MKSKNYYLEKYGYKKAVSLLAKHIRLNIEKGDTLAARLSAWRLYEVTKCCPYIYTIDPKCMLCDKCVYE